MIILTGRSLHYLYSSLLSETLYAVQLLLNQFSNFVGCLSCNHGTDEQTLSTPEHGWDKWLEFTSNSVTQCVWEDARMLTQPSTVHKKYNGKTSYLLGNVGIEILELAGTGYLMNEVQTM